MLLWWVVLLASAFALLPRAAGTRTIAISLAAFAGLAAWIAVSLSWTESRERTVIELARVVGLGGHRVRGRARVPRRAVAARRGGGHRGRGRRVRAGDGLAAGPRDVRQPARRDAAAPPRLSPLLLERARLLVGDDRGAGPQLERARGPGADARRRARRRVPGGRCRLPHVRALGRRGDRARHRGRDRALAPPLARGRARPRRAGRHRGDRARRAGRARGGARHGRRGRRRGRARPRDRDARRRARDLAHRLGPASSACAWRRPGRAGRSWSPAWSPPGPPRSSARPRRTARGTASTGRPRPSPAIRRTGSGRSAAPATRSGAQRWTRSPRIRCGAPARARSSSPGTAIRTAPTSCATPTRCIWRA